MCEIMMITTTLFKNNQNQAVRLPKAVEFPATVKEVTVRRNGCDIILSPKGSTWESFFNNPEWDNDSVVFERGPLLNADRETLE
jgi:antitoxin VapB